MHSGGVQHVSRVSIRLIRTTLPDDILVMYSHSHAGLAAEEAKRQEEKEHTEAGRKARRAFIKVCRRHGLAPGEDGANKDTAVFSAEVRLCGCVVQEEGI